MSAEGVGARAGVAYFSAHLYQCHLLFQGILTIFWSHKKKAWQLLKILVAWKLWIKIVLLKCQNACICNLSHCWKNYMYRLVFQKDGPIHAAFGIVFDQLEFSFLYRCKIKRQHHLWLKLILTYSESIHATCNLTSLCVFARSHAESLVRVLIASYSWWEHNTRGYSLLLSVLALNSCWEPDTGAYSLSSMLRASYGCLKPLMVIASYSCWEPIHMLVASYFRL